MQKIVLLLLPLLFATCYCYSRQTASSFCRGLPAGQYCTDSLNGYYNCNGRSRGYLYKCRGSYKCTCHLKKKCVVPRNEICRPQPTPLPFAENYMIIGFGVETITAVDGSSKTQNLHSQIISNSVTGKFRRERWTGPTHNPNTYWFQYYFLQQNGKYSLVSFFYWLIDYLRCIKVV